MKLVVLVCLISIASANMMIQKSWLTSCKACNDILKECQECVKGGCYTCVSEIENSKCSKCASEIQTAGENIYCDGGIDYHRMVCTVR